MKVRSALVALALAVAGVLLPATAATAASDRGYGHLDLVAGQVRSVQAAGWIIDPATSASVYVYIWIDGGAAGSGYAAIERPDVADAYPGYGPYHGFTVTVPAPPGFHTVCMYLSSAGPAGGWSPIDCRTANVTP